MLSYIHAYHAGNHADILKHLTLLCELLLDCTGNVLYISNDKSLPIKAAGNLSVC